MTSLLEHLRKIQTHLEQEYLGIGESYEKLISEMEQSLQQGSRIVDDFKQQISRGQSDSLAGRVDGINTLVQKETAEHLALLDDSRELMESLTDIYERLSTLDEPISEIQDSAELMSLLAINSMVVAIQVGSSGGGFTCITEELKSASANTHLYASEIERMGKRVSDGYTRFTSLTGEIFEKEKTVSTFLRDELPLSYMRFRQSIEEFVSQLENLEMIAEGLQPQLLTIMQSLQNQDIIRQSMDHVIISILELQAGEFKTEAGDSGYLLLKQQLFSLSRTVMADIRGWIENDLKNLRTGHSSCEDIIKSLQEEKEKLVSADNGKFPRIVNGLASFQENINKILMDTESNLKIRKTLFYENRVLMQAVKDLAPQINGLSELVDFFRNINVMAKIEIARTDAFINIKDSVGEMVEIDNRIEKAVERIIEITNYISNSNEDNQKAFNQIIDHDKRFVETFRHDIKALMGLAEESIEILKGVFGWFYCFVRRLHGVLF